jgi:integrating conjugative element protein (TIGR03759 family)
MVVGLISGVVVWAQQTDETANTPGTSLMLSTRPTHYMPWHLTTTREEWGLDEADWAHYQVLMRGEAGLHYTHMAPIFVLGLYADNKADQRRFAEAYARYDADRLDRLFNFNRAWRDARARLYPNAKMIDRAMYARREAILDSPLYSLKKPRLSIYMNTRCKTCEPVIRSLVRQNREMDIFFVGARDESQIQAWAQKMALPYDAVNQNRITLNFDDGWFETYGSGEFPAIYENGEAGFVPVALKDLN